jgi:hypothetical protein
MSMVRRRVGDVGDVPAAARTSGEVPDHPGVGGAEERVAALGRRAQPVDVSSSHWSLPPEK